MKFQTAIFVIFAIAIYRVIVIASGSIPVDIEEAYYTSWKHTLDWGYYSKPPLMPFLLWLITSVFGESGFVIKTLSLVIHTITALVIGYFAKELYGEKVASLSAIIFQSLPFVGVISVVATTDAPLVLMWALSLWMAFKAINTEALRYWILLGIFGGLGMLSKFTYALMPIGLLIFILLSNYRKVLLRKGIWIAAIIASLIWLPNILWMANHEWITLIHTKDISGVEQSSLDWASFANFSLSQFAVFGPLSLSLLLILFFKSGSWDGRWWFLFASASPLMLLVLMQSLQSDANMNWATPSYVGFVVLLALWLRNSPRLAAIVFISNLTIVSAIYHYDDIAKYLDFELTDSTDPFSRQRGWAELASKTSDLLNQCSGAALLSESREVLAQIRFQLPSDIKPDINLWNPSLEWYNQYAIHQNINKSLGNKWLWIETAPISEGNLNRFSSYIELGGLEAALYTNKSRKLYAYCVSDFMGY